MADWRTSLSAQSSPHSLDKISKNLKEFMHYWQSGQSILDVGCGVGAVYSFLGRPEKYIGVDRNAGELEKARQYFDADFREGDLFDLDLKADWVLCSRVLMHVGETLRAIQKLRSYGRLCLIVPVGKDEVSKIETYEGKTYFRTFSRELLESAGSCKITEFHPYATVIYDPLLP